MGEVRIGVDFGTCYSNVGYRDQLGMHFVQDPAAPQRSDSIPSSALLRADDSFVFGVLAESEKNAAPEGYQREFKRDLGSSAPYLLRDRKILAADLTAEFLGFLVGLTEQKLGAKPTAAVITIPAAYNQYRRNLVEEAAQHAGLARASLVAEPVAAVIGAAERGEIADHATTLVYDLGGGTFDAAVVRLDGGTHQVLGDKGLADFGGTDIDVLIERDFAAKAGDEFASILADLDSGDPKRVARAMRIRIAAQDFCRNIKHRLSSTDRVADVLPVDFGYELSRPQLEDMVRPHLDRTVSICRELLAGTALTPEQIDTVLLVGGGSYMPLVEKVMATELGRPVKRTADPELAVCMGAAILARTGPPPAAGRQAQEAATRAAQEAASRQAEERAREAEAQKQAELEAENLAQRWELLAKQAGEKAKETTPGQAWRETPEVFPLQAQMRRQAAASRWADVIETSSQIARLNPAAADPYGLATMARERLTEQTRLAPATEHAEREAEKPHQPVVTVGRDPSEPVVSTRTDSQPAQLSPVHLRTITAADAIHAIAFSPDGTRLALACAHRLVQIVDLAGRQQLKMSQGAGSGDVHDVAYDPQGSRVASVGYGAYIWDASTGRELLKLHRMTNLYAVAFSPDGAKIATATPSGVARISDASTARKLLVIKHGNQERVNGVAFSPDGSQLATASFDKTAAVWDASTGRQLLKVTLPGKVNGVAFSQDRALLAVASYNKPAQIWDVSTKRQLLQVAHTRGSIRVAFSPDGTLLATAGDDNGQIWDTSTGRELFKVTHTGPVNGIAFSRDGTLLASASTDKTVQLWRLK